MAGNGLQRPDDVKPDIDPDVTIREVRGEKEIGLMGMKHLQMTEQDRDRIHDVYSDILIELDDLDDEFTGAERAWQVGRVLAEYEVAEDDEMTLKELGIYNTLEQMYARRLFYARKIYAFWPDKGYNSQHTVSALGEFASRALNQGREDEATAGYQRLIESGDNLTKSDVFAWSDLNDSTIDAIVEAVCNYYETADRLSESVKRVILLTNQDPRTFSQGIVTDSIKQHLESDSSID